MTGATVAEAAPAAPARRPSRTLAARAARTAGAVLVVVATTLAGIGWLDLLRRWGVLHGAPHLREALPLQRLAGNGAQPVPRVIAAWLPAGLFAGLALRAIGLRRRLARAAVTFCGCALLLLVLGAFADAISETDPLLSHVGQQPGRAVIWLAAALAAAGAAALGRGRERPPRHGARGPDGSGP
jgi:hypothetical protein